jgi:GDP-L-fucose synthase
MGDNFWADQSVIVTGGAGFLGSYVVQKLRDRGASNIFVVRSKDYDLRHEEAVRKLLKDVKATMIIHMAAVVGGIGANREHPGQFFYDNLMMGAMLIEHARQNEIAKFVAIGTICAYPKFTPVPFREEDLWNGYPEETNAPYGLAKKMLLVQSQAYRQEYGYNSIYLLPTNLYGPNDNFDPRTSHVIPALILKCTEAVERGAPYIEVWGDGSPTREFLYVRDAAEAIVLAAEHYNDSEPVNLGSGVEISIRDLAALIAELVGFKGEIRYDPSKPNGQPRRQVDVTRARQRFGFQASTSFREGLRETIEWYRSEVLAATR